MKIRWGVLGTGNIVARAGRGIQESEHGLWHGVAGRNRENSAAAAERYGVPVFYDHYEQLLNDPDIDAVYIALLTHLHTEWAIKACEAGKHVLVEKPFSLTLEEALEIKDAAERNRVCAGEAFVWEFHPAYSELKTRIQQGDIGELVQFNGHFSFNAYPESTRWKKAWGGGSLYDIGCYPVSWSRYFMDDEPEAVDGSMLVHPVEQVDTRFFASLYYPQGRIAQVSSALDMQLGSYFELLGTEGRMKVTMNVTPDTMTLIADHRDQRSEWAMNRLEMFALQADRFVEHIQAGKQGIVDGAIAQAHVIESLVRSAELGSRIKLD